jgi:putative NADH-flavin reductase
MKIALFGASGMIGQRIAQEALSRGHQVTGIVRHPEKAQITHPQFTVTTGDALNADSVAQVAAGHDVVVSAISPGDNPQVLVDSAHSLIAGVRRAQVGRLVVVGGAGSLEVAPGVLLLDTSKMLNVPWRPAVLAHRDGLEVYRKSDVNWTFFSPADRIAPGERTGAYRLGTDQLVTNEQGESFISAEDYAVALVDELEKPQFIRRRFTTAY